jgi:hypothetical protein
MQVNEALRRSRACRKVDLSVALGISDVMSVWRAVRLEM